MGLHPANTPWADADYGPHISPDAERVAGEHIRAVVNRCRTKRRFRAPCEAERVKANLPEGASIVLDQGLLIVDLGHTILVQSMREHGITGKENWA